MSDEQIEGVVSAHGKDITSLQEKVNGLTSERDGLKSQLDERDQQLVDLQKNSKNVKLIRKRAQTSDFNQGSSPLN